LLERLHQRLRDDQQLQVGRQAELHADAQLLALDVGALRRAPLEPPRQLAELAVDDEAVAVALALELVALLLCPGRDFAEVRTQPLVGEEALEHRRLRSTR